MRLRVWPFVFAVAALARPASPAPPCGPLGGPTALAQQLVVDFTDGNDDYVSLSWTPSPITNKYEFMGYRLERRDETAGGAFAQWNYVQNPATTGLITTRDYMKGPPFFSCSAGRPACAELGHTYAYRVITEFRYTISCPEYDGGVVHDSTTSNEVSVAIPNVPPPAGAPKNLVAVAETKTNRVHLSWEAADAVKPTKYVVQRREIPPADTLAKEEIAFVTIAELAATKLEYLDKKGLSDRQYEYRVLSAVAQELLESNADRAFTNGKCPANRAFKTWSGGIGEWSLHFDAPDIEDDQYGINFYNRTEDSFVAAITSHLGVLGGGLLVTGRDSKLATDGRAAWSAPAKVTSLDLDAESPAFFRDLLKDDKGLLSVKLVPAESPFEQLAFRKMTGSMKFLYGRGRKSVNLPFHGTKSSAEGNGVSTRLCGTAAAGVDNKEKGKPGAYVPVKPTDHVVFVFQCAVLGPAPLYARRASVEVTVENGVIVGSLPGYATEWRADPVGKTTARFDVGALGPDAHGRTKVAGMAVFADVTGAPGKQLRCRFKFVDDSAAPFAGHETLSFTPAERVVELKIVAPPPPGVSAPR